LSDTQVEVLPVILWWSCDCNINIRQDSSQLVWLVTPHTKVDTICCEGPSWRLQWWWFENSTSLTKVPINLHVIAFHLSTHTTHCIHPWSVTN